MRNPASKFQTIGAMTLLLLGAGTQLVSAQTSVPQQLNDLRKQVNQTGQPSPAPTQSKPPAPTAQPVVKPQANPPAPATKPSATTQAKPSTPPAPQAQAKAKSPAPALPATQVAVKPQAGKPPAAPTARVEVRPGTQVPVKVVNVKPGTTELGPRAQPPATVTKTAVVPAAPVATSAVAVVPPVPERPNAARRDPFDPLVGKVKDAPSGGPQAPLPAGKPGLVVATLRVDGVVKGTNGMIAIVSNPQLRVYFLREGDHLYDGNVEHISMEGVSFHETGKDAFGKSVEREVTKRLYSTPGEQQ